MASSQPARPSRPRPGGAPSRGGGGSSGPKRSGSAAGRGRPPADRGPTARAGRGPGRGRYEAPARPLTAAERRAAEVRGRAAPRHPATPMPSASGSTSAPPSAGSSTIRSTTACGTRPSGQRPRASRSGRPVRPLGSPVDPVVAAQIAAVAADRRIAERMVARLGQAQDALERDRLDEAKRLISQVARTVPGVAAVHEVAGLVGYRLGQWRVAVRELETAQALRPNVALLPVIADSYRGAAPVERGRPRLARDPRAVARPGRDGRGAHRRGRCPGRSGRSRRCAQDDGRRVTVAQASPRAPPQALVRASATSTTGPATSSRRSGGSSASPPRRRLRRRAGPSAGPRSPLTPSIGPGRHGQRP